MDKNRIDELMEKFEEAKLEIDSHPLSTMMFVENELLSEMELIKDLLGEVGETILRARFALDLNRPWPPKEWDEDR